MRDRFAVQRHTALPMEPRGVLAEWDAAQGRMTVLGAAKVPFFNRDTLAAMLGLSPARVNLIENDVGGGFGARGEFYPEDFLIVLVRVRVCVIGAIQSAQLNGSNQSTAMQCRASGSPVAATPSSAGPGVPRYMRSLRSEDI
jgi:CO/xanthine dehydrogenase Mo-binding subunit